jgi:hypothetical protein
LLNPLLNKYINTFPNAFYGSEMQEPGVYWRINPRFFPFCFIIFFPLLFCCLIRVGISLCLVSSIACITGLSGRPPSGRAVLLHAVSCSLGRVRNMLPTGVAECHRFFSFLQACRCLAPGPHPLFLPVHPIMSCGAVKQRGRRRGRWLAPPGWARKYADRMGKGFHSNE